MGELLDYHRHLAEIHAAPRWLWPAMVRDELRHVDGIDFDDVADRKHKEMLAERKLTRHGGDRKRQDKVVNLP